MTNPQQNALAEALERIAELQPTNNMRCGNPGSLWGTIITMQEIAKSALASLVSTEGGAGATVAACPCSAFDREAFSADVRAKLERDGMSYREAAPVVPCSPATLNRVARGHAPDVENYLRICRWLTGTDQPEALASNNPAAVEGQGEVERAAAVLFERGDDRKWADASPEEQQECRYTARGVIAALAPAPGQDNFQARVAPWMQQCFGPEISNDRVERGDRFLEEALELLQSGGYDPGRIPALVGYVWSRPVGEPSQEIGGVMVTLAAYCLAYGLDMHEAGETELARINVPAIIEKIRVKQATKAAAIGNTSPLPIAPNADREGV